MSLCKNCGERTPPRSIDECAACYVARKLITDADASAVREQRAAEAMAIVETLAAMTPAWSTCPVCGGDMSGDEKDHTHFDDCLWLRARKWAGK